jgi:hypothetical protein
MNVPRPPQSPIFDYRVLRLLIGLIAFSMPVFAKLNSSEPIASISGSYWTGNRDVFVGLTFVLGALFWAYNGHTLTEKWVSKTAAVAAIITAIFPTACYECDSDLDSKIHYGAAVFLFLTIAYFCLFAFRDSALGKPGEEAKRRALIYLVCGLIIVASLLFAAIAYLVWSDADRKSLAITYIVEWVSLWAFAAAWMTASKAVPLLASDTERLRFSLR